MCNGQDKDMKKGNSMQRRKIKNITTLTKNVEKAIKRPEIEKSTGKL